MDEILANAPYVSMSEEKTWLAGDLNEENT